jgi:hypothetical protein
LRREGLYSSTGKQVARAAQMRLPDARRATARTEGRTRHGRVGALATGEQTPERAFGTGRTFKSFLWPKNLDPILSNRDMSS